jgi:hypothetical protein
MDGVLTLNWWSILVCSPLVLQCRRENHVFPKLGLVIAPEAYRYGCLKLGIYVKSPGLTKLHSLLLEFSFCA